jgi:hypothetical protein
VKPAGISGRTGEYLKDKINKLATKGKKMNIRNLYRGINEFKKDYQPRSNLVKDEIGDLIADSHNILNREKKYFSQLLRVNDVRQIEMHTAEPLVPDPSPSENEIAIAKLTRYNSLGSDQIPAEFIQAGCKILWSEIHKFINFIWNNEELPDQWKKSVIIPVHKNREKTDCSNYRRISLRLRGLEVRVRFPELPNFLRSSGSGTGSTQPRRDN